MRRYKANKKPKPRDWLNLSEERRIALVETAHVGEGIEPESLRAHAVIHVVVENQLAENISEVVDAYQRLRKDGLDRHDCIHAIGSVLIDYLYEPGTVSSDDYTRKLNALTARGWINKFDAP